MIRSRYPASLGLALAPAICSAQAPGLDPAQQQAMIRKAIELIRANYVIPEQAAILADAMEANLESGKYAGLAKPDAFLEAVNQDLQTLGKDKHLRIVANPRIVQQLKREAAGDTAVSPAFLALLKDSNYRLKRVESIEGNIGYFKFDNFVELAYVKDAFVGAMNFLQASSAIVLDLTDNGGGASETANFLVSYFLPEGVKIGTTYNRASGQTTVTRVIRPQEVKPLLDTPLVILVSGRTASAAEAVAYTLQQAKRAVVVGGRTKGLANAGVQLPIDDRHFVIVPTLLHKNAVSGTNWEGTGVTPDIQIPEEFAFSRAMAKALEAAAETKTRNEDRRKLLFFAQEYHALAAPQTLPATLRDACQGSYQGGRNVILKEGALRLVQGNSERRLTYMGGSTFIVEGRKDYRVEFPLENGKASKMVVVWFDATSDVFGRM